MASAAVFACRAWFVRLTEGVLDHTRDSAINTLVRVRGTFPFGEKEMATINQLANITARCPGCRGALSTYEWRNQGKEYGSVQLPGEFRLKGGLGAQGEHRLYKCGGCGRGGLALILSSGHGFPAGPFELVAFHQEVTVRLDLPDATPQGIVAEFREAEKCQSSGCHRAAAGMFRSVLDKTLRANGYKLKAGTNLQQQIDMAAEDGIITAARQRRAHDEVRVLGNDGERPVRPS
jgi:hypothetical protein